MKRMLATACAAMMLAGTLTACSRDTNGTGTGTGTDQNNNNGTTNPTGTAFASPGRTAYPDGADEDRARYHEIVGSRYTANSDGRYTAYSDGTVDAGRNTRTGSTMQKARREGEDFLNDVGNAVEDAGRGVGDAAYDITHGQY